MFEVLMIVALSLLSIAILLNIYRAVKGPSGADRVLALDAIGINLIAGSAVLIRAAAHPRLFGFDPACRHPFFHRDDRLCPICGKGCRH